MSTVEEIIGRTDPNDFEAVLAMTNTDPNEVIHAVEDNASASTHGITRKARAPSWPSCTRKQK